MNVTDVSVTDRTVELRVTTLDNTRHQLTLTKEGQVTDHWSDRYPSDNNISPIEQERMERVERFSKYYVLRTRQFPLLTPYSQADQIADPDRLAVTGLLFGAIAKETLVSQLRSCYDQLTAMRRGDELPVTPPQAAPDAEWKLIEQDIHLTLDLGEIQRLVDVLRELNGLAEIRHALDVDPDYEDAALFDRLNRILTTQDFHTDERTSSEQFLQVISPLRVHWQADEPTRIEYGDGTQPDEDATLAARIQLTPSHTPVISKAAFQRTLVDHFRSQVRDCYVGMGLRPPTDARVTGRGIAACTDSYEHHDELQNYHDEYAIIDWTGLSPCPDFSSHQLS
ncbi:hypothetical protein ACERIM_07380 [Natrinema sp. H-ect1]|uniref:hypothetical protein n=1 Tax=Natrinema sp. H-ect1 TaxID=3242700 RepID=UPI000677AEE2